MEERLAVEDAALCLYETYRANDAEAAALYVFDEAVVDTLFTTPWELPEWTFEGCEPSPDDANTFYCSFSVDAEVHGGVIEMRVYSTPSAGAGVDAVEFYG